MAYTINKTDGTVVTTIIDGTADQSTSLTLIGKNYTGFGESINENFVKLLENFSNTTAPAPALVGQLWYDTSEARLKVYTPTGWKSAGGPIVSSVSPLEFATGDIWIDNSENQLYFFDGSDLILAGPIWKRNQGKTGHVAETLYDADKIPKSVLYLYVKDSLLGIYSSEEFVPSPSIPGFAKIYKGYTSNSLIQSVSAGVSSNSNALQGYSALQFMRSDAAAVNTQKITVQNNNGITIGNPQLVDLKITGTTFFIENLANDGDIVLKTNTSTGSSNAIYIDSGTNRVGIFTVSPQQTLDIAGDLRVRGNFTVEGDTTSVKVSVLQVEDRNIELGYTTDSSPSDLSANGGGLILKGTTDKTIIYNNNNQSFDISENINLKSGKSLRIAGIDVITSTALGSSITSATGITSIGTLNSLAVSNLYMNNNRISSVGLNSNIEIEPNGSGDVALIGSPKITGLASPVSNSDAATKLYADNFSKQQQLSLSIIDNGLTASINDNIILLLNDIAAPAQFVPNKEALVHVQHIDFGTQAVTRYLKKFNINANYQWVFVNDLTSSI